MVSETELEDAVYSHVSNVDWCGDGEHPASFHIIYSILTDFVDERVCYRWPW